MIDIEKHVPIIDGRGLAAKYRWQDMDVGDSFRADVSPNALRSAARYQAAKRGTAYVVRKDGDGSRAWRTA